MSEQRNLEGRPSVIDDDVVAKLIEILKEGASTARACSYAQIHPATFYRHMQIDESFAREVNSAKAYVGNLAMKVVVGAIKKGDLQTSKWWLERKCLEEFGLREIKKETVNIFNSPEFVREYAK